MIRHVVMWRLHAEALGRPRQENALALVRLLEAMRGRVDGLLELEVGINEAPDENASDLVLVSSFRDAAALQAYLAHPLHRDVAELMKAVRSERRVVDYTVG